MKWIFDFQLFLFDFDGLLVNTEHLHYSAYVNMLKEKGYPMDWSFAKFCQLAHLNATALKEALYQEIPNLDPNWSFLYEEKKRHYFSLLQSGQIKLMPGVHALLFELEKAKIRRCVVTNSTYPQIEIIRSQIPILQTIPKWVTREDYEKPKPSPDGYLRAIELYGKKGDRIIGFEDSLRGLAALKMTPAIAVLISPDNAPFLEGNVLHFRSFEEILSNKLTM